MNPSYYIAHFKDSLSADCFNLLGMMLRVTPERRPSAEQCLNHSWFKKDRGIVSIMISVNRRSVSPISRFDPNQDSLAKIISDVSSFLLAPNYYNKEDCSLQNVCNYIIARN